MTMRFKRQRIDAKRFPDNVRHKWPLALLEEGFVPMPKKVLRALSTAFGPSEQMEELALVLAAVDYRRRNITRYPSLEYLAFIAGLPTGRAREALDRLVEKKWVELTEDPSDDGLNLNLQGFFDVLARHSGEDAEE